MRRAELDEVDWNWALVGGLATQLHLSPFYILTPNSSNEELFEKCRGDDIQIPRNNVRWDDRPAEDTGNYHRQSPPDECAEIPHRCASD